jgi:hypothetical protein
MRSLKAMTKEVCQRPPVNRSIATCAEQRFSTSTPSPLQSPWIEQKSCPRRLFQSALHRAKVLSATSIRESRIDGVCAVLALCPCVGVWAVALPLRFAEAGPRHRHGRRRHSCRRRLTPPPPTRRRADRAARAESRADYSIRESRIDVVCASDGVTAATIDAKTPKRKLGDEQSTTPSKLKSCLCPRTLRLSTRCACPPGNCRRHCIDLAWLEHIFS